MVESIWEPAPVPPAAAGLEAAGLPGWKAACLARRGVEAPEEAAAFLAPSLAQLSPPEDLPGIAAAAERLAQASEMLQQSPMALQLRYLQTLREVAAENNSTTLFPIPIDLFKPFMENLPKIAEALSKDKK